MDTRLSVGTRSVAGETFTGLCSLDVALSDDI
jgi:hypothetical protein